MFSPSPVTSLLFAKQLSLHQPVVCCLLNKLSLACTLMLFQRRNSTVKVAQSLQIVSAIFQWNSNEKKKSKQQVDSAEHGNVDD